MPFHQNFAIAHTVSPPIFSPVVLDLPFFFSPPRGGWGGNSTQKENDILYLSLKAGWIRYQATKKPHGHLPLTDEFERATYLPNDCSYLESYQLRAKPLILTRCWRMDHRWWFGILWDLILHLRGKEQSCPLFRNIFDLVWTLAKARGRGEASHHVYTSHPYPRSSLLTKNPSL